MPYITREDGERFVIPSYRDVLTAKQKSQLKKEILLLSQSYGEYITLQKKSPTQYEVAFSTDTGYLLGESIWQHFNRPLDMIYCEAIPNTTEAILVIVKAGSVYLDGSFPMDSIPEELIIFLTQQNNFEIYTYGDVPISEMPQEGKFSFDTASVKSFTVLSAPVFPTLPLLKMYQLQLVDTVLKAQGIGVFPTRQLLTFLVVVGLLWMAFSYITSRKPEEVSLAPVNPYQGYYQALSSPAPDKEMTQFIENLRLLFSIPGWMPVAIDYAHGTLTAQMQTAGSQVQLLFDWAKLNQATTDIREDGIYLIMTNTFPNRSTPTHIYNLKEVIGSFVDRLARVYPGNNVQLTNFTKQNAYTSVRINIKISNATPIILSMIGEQLRELPCVLQGISLKLENGTLTGSILIDALGS